MDAADGNSLAAIGFLTALEDVTHGWFGGYLVLSQLGRPLEFHCTAPIRPTRTQQILYGPTLRPYLLGEVIGHALVKQAELPVGVILTNLSGMLSLSLLRETPVAWVEEVMDPARRSVEADGAASESRILGEPREEVDGLGPRLDLGRLRIHGTSTCGWGPEDLRQQLTPMVDHIDLLEPFGRIRDAILEAQRISSEPGEEANAA